MMALISGSPILVGGLGNGGGLPVARAFDSEPLLLGKWIAL